MNAIGIDGCPAGWFYVLLQKPSRYEFGVIEHISEILPWLSEDSLVLIDIPIGLTDSSHGRKCDQEARNVLKPLRHSSVFSPPCREAIRQKTYQEASLANYHITGKKLSKQSWLISSKIEEVDGFLLSQDTGIRNKVREIHPEVAFWSLNGRKPIPFSKKKAEGFEARKRLLKRYLDQADEIIERALQKHRRKQVARDDIVDALVAALTASKHQNLSTLPEVVDYDEYGLPMEIVYGNCG